MPDTPLVIAVDASILALAVVLGILYARLQTVQFDYSIHPEVLRRRRQAALKSAPLRRTLGPLSDALGRGVAGFGFNAHFSRVRRLLSHSGNADGFSAQEFVGFGLASGLLAGLALMLFGWISSGSVSLIITLLVVAGVYWIRLQQLQGTVDRRRALTGRQLPYVLDLVALSMGAGATFLNACRTIAAREAQGPVEEEIGMILAEVEGGIVLSKALHNATQRTQSEDFTATLLAVKQGAELGTPLVSIFKRQAELNRFIRSQRGEQAAAKLPNQLAVPTTFLMMAVMLLFFGPIIVRAVRGDLGS